MVEELEEKVNVGKGKNANNSKARSVMGAFRECFFAELDGDVYDFAILITQVDPDAIGAALGLWEFMQNSSMVSSMVSCPEIYYCGEVNHPQNRMIRNKMDQWGMTLSPVPHGQDLSTFMLDRQLALVDSSSINDGRLPVAWRGQIRPTVIIDHHSGGQSEAGCVTHCRPNGRRRLHSCGRALGFRRLVRADSARACCAVGSRYP